MSEVPGGTLFSFLFRHGCAGGASRFWGVPRSPGLSALALEVIDARHFGKDLQEQSIPEVLSDFQRTVQILLLVIMFANCFLDFIPLLKICLEELPVGSASNSILKILVHVRTRRISRGGGAAALVFRVAERSRIRAYALEAAPLTK